MAITRQKAKKPKIKDYLHWLDQHGYFARQVFMDGLTFIMAVRSGRVFAICTNGGGHSGQNGTLAEFERSGGKAHCVRSLGDLENLYTIGVL